MSIILFYIFITQSRNCFIMRFQTFLWSNLRWWQVMFNTPTRSLYSFINFTLTFSLSNVFHVALTCAENLKWMVRVMVLVLMSIFHKTYSIFYFSPSTTSDKLCPTAPIWCSAPYYGALPSTMRSPGRIEILNYSKGTYYAAIYIFCLANVRLIHTKI